MRVPRCRKLKRAILYVENIKVAIEKAFRAALL